ncbi:MAG: hypothetical protein R3B96_09575 [Pirellulaceae bacterium]
MRLEVLPAESLPFSGPGRCDNGNLHVTEWRAAWRADASSAWTGAADRGMRVGL